MGMSVLVMGARLEAAAEWLIGVVVLGVGLLIILAWKIPSPRQVLQKWADDRHLTIEAAQRRIWRRGPFWWRCSTAQAVFRITVREPSGVVRHGYARVGGFSGFGDYVEVVWDRDPESDVDVPDVDDYR